MNKFIKWTPRILTILFIAFLSMFSFDVFFEGYGFPEIIVAFVMHNVPTFVVALFLIYAWKKPKWGGWPFIIAGLCSIVFFKTYRDPIVFLIVSFPAILIGLLFIYDGIRSNPKRTRKNKNKK